MADLVLKGGLGMAIAALLGGVLYLNHEERVAEAEGRQKIIIAMISQCFDAAGKQNFGAGFDSVINLYELAGLDSDLEYVERLVEEDENAAGN